eukprot:765205-Hanusia_phi.AAC.2
MKFLACLSSSLSSKFLPPPPPAPSPLPLAFCAFSTDALSRSPPRFGLGGPNNSYSRGRRAEHVAAMSHAASCQDDDEPSWGSEFEDEDDSEEDNLDNQIESVCLKHVLGYEVYASDGDDSSRVDRSSTRTRPVQGHVKPDLLHDVCSRNNTGISQYMQDCDKAGIRLQPCIVAALNSSHMQLENSAGLVERECGVIAAAMKHNRGTCSSPDLATLP